ncbi:unnamed protein product, partial [Anisakis simplex]|uniref:Col_cuticle_N domain-containing protein n=1 Tax=Anisakis simplex TaxID=6269 RepID=A0A0M3JKM6_ANISI
MESVDKKRIDSDDSTQRVATISAIISLVCVALIAIAMPAFYYQLDQAKSRLNDRMDAFK